MITAETIDRVREAADIVEIIGEDVKLRRSGGDWRGACPFHGGKNPNFSVSPRRNAYHCFKCGVKGDVFSYVRERKGLDFVEAVKYVAQRAGIEVKEERRSEHAADPREPLWEANAAAAEWFRDTLWTDDEAKAARDYLASREIDRTAADRFQLGWAPRDGNRLRAHLHALGYDDDRLVAAGLLMLREGDTEPRSRFWGRLMIPILDASGRCVGFGGRVIGQGEPKYLNSSESDVFSKGRLLYGLTSARHAARKADRIIVVEGYFDAIRLALAGVEEVVAPLGTALTEQQGALIAKLTKNVFLLYDSDAAGLKATFRNGDELLRHGISARVASLPEGEDPDTFVRAHGAAGLESQLAHAVDIFDRKVLELRRRGWFDDVRKKRLAVDKLLPTLRATSDAITRDIYVATLAQLTGVERDALVREIAAGDRSRRERGARSEGASSGMPAGEPVSVRPAASATDAVVYEVPRAARDDARRREWRSDRRRGMRRQEDWHSAPGIPRPLPSAAMRRIEKGLIRAILFSPDQVDWVAERMGPEQLHLAVYQRIFERLLVTETRDIPALSDTLAPDDIAVINELMAEHPPSSELDAGLWLRKLQVLALDEERARINARLKSTDGPIPDDEHAQLVARKEQIQQERQAILGR